MFVFCVLFLAAAFSIVGQACHRSAAYYEPEADLDVDYAEFVSLTFPDSIPEDVSMEEVYLGTITASILTDVDYDLTTTPRTQPFSKTEFATELKDQSNAEHPAIEENKENQGAEPEIHPEKCEPCSPRHLQNRFCHSDFVIQGRIAPNNFTSTNWSLFSHLNNTYSKSNQTWIAKERRNKALDNETADTESLQNDEQNASSSYQVILERTLKGSNGLQHRHGVVQIFYNAPSVRCHGKELEQQTSYIFMGSVTDGRLELRKCDWPLELSKLTGSQRHGLKHHYRRFCRHCKVDTQIVPPDPRSTSSYSHVCVYNPTLYHQWGQEDCEGDYSVCAKTNMGTCHWLKSQQMQACVERRDNDRGLGMPPAPVWVVPDPN